MKTDSTRNPDPDLLQTVREAYDRGQVVEALRRAEGFAPLRQWRGAEACVLASRIAANTGAPRLAVRLAIRARREDPIHGDALAQYCYEVVARRGPLALWQFLRRHALEPQGSPERRAELLALRARAATDLRDFAHAESLLAAAEALDPGRAWIRLQRAHWLEHQDRVAEALEVARAAGALHPHPCYRPGVHTQAVLLQQLDRDEAAIHLLQAADAVLQSSLVTAQLYALLSENGRWSEAETTLEHYLALSPLLEARGRSWVDSQRARVAYQLGRRADAAGFAALLPDEFHQQFAQKLRDAPEIPERTQLDVSFVRQDFKTCAPATLAALGRFWRMPADHLKLAAAMCYDGTPSWQQRGWAEQHGWCVREFRVTLESARALLERGIPFAISTVEATSAHMMAVIGFDRARGTLLLRDPGQPYVIESPAEPFLKRYRAFGPHGMVFLPEAERARIEGLELPESELLDRSHQVRLALSKHDRPAAAARLQELEVAAPDAAVTWETRLELASYDANPAEQVRCLDALLERFPNNPARQLHRLHCLRETAREERLRWVEDACRRNDADPALFIALARTLQGDARCLAKARGWLRRALRLRPLDSSAISALADGLWEEGELEEATECHRIAANLESFRESLYQAWFIACRRTRRTDEALAHLQDRFARFGARSEQPALTLAWAWREMEQPGRARDVLTEAARLRPEDDTLKLRSAVLLARLGEQDEANRRLDAVRGRVRENDWRRTAAEIAELRLRPADALHWARELLKLEPLALDAHGGVARALAGLEGTAAARAHLQAARALAPHHCGLQRMVVEWSREAGTEAVEAAARELLRLEPDDAWARRELALAFLNRQRGEEALNEATEAARIEPGNPFSFSVLGHAHRQLGQISEARESYRKAVGLSVDNADATGALLELARTDEERKAELAFIERELVRQVVTGDGLLTYVEMARPILEPEALLGVLKQAHHERPDLWHAGSALVSELGHQGRVDEALVLGKEATTRFPHLPRVWLDLAQVHRWRHEPEAEIAAAERAFEISPSWSRAALAVTDALERGGRLDDARHYYERALGHSPHDAELHASLAHLLRRQRSDEDAFAAIERALRRAPAYDWAWSLLSEWSEQAGQPQRPAKFARTLTQERPGALRGWLILARVLKDADTGAERLAAVQRALELAAHSTEAWDLKAQLLTEFERFDEAVQACAEGAAVCRDEVHLLRGRQAWIEASRRNLPGAVQLMRAVLKDNASYVWGWHQLAGWLIEQGALVDATAALEQMQRLRPHDGWVLRQLGFLRLKQDDRPGAQKAFASALEVSPTDAAAAHNLFELQLEAGELEDAAKTLQVMQTHQPGTVTLAEEIILRLRRGEDPAALQLLKTLCTSPDPDSWPLNAATLAFQRANRSARALKVLKRALATGGAHAEVGATAIRRLLEQRSFLAASRLFLRLKPGEGQQRAAAPLIQGLAQQKREWLIRWVLWRRREVLFQDDAAWGYVGFALSEFNRRRQHRCPNEWVQSWA